MLLSDKYPFLTNYFTQAVLHQDKANLQSIVLYGNDLEAQFILAKEIARLLNCQKDKSDNCECLNCKWIRENSHPEVKIISRLDNKPEDDDSKTVISIKQSALIKENLMNSSDYHRVFIFCDKDDDGHILGLNQLNFQAETANSLLKTIEEPQEGVTFIFLTRYIDDLLSTIISRSQCFFVPSMQAITYDYSSIKDIFENYWNFKRSDVFDISEKLQNLAKETSTIKILEEIQNYVFVTLKNNPKNTNLINDIKYIEEAKHQAEEDMRPINIFDDLCLKLIK